MVESLSLPPQPAAPVPNAAALAGASSRAQAVQQFEAMLIGELASMMIGTVPTDGMFGGGHAEEIYRGMMAEHLGNSVARRGGLGLAPSLMDELIRMQGAV